MADRTIRNALIIGAFVLIAIVIGKFIPAVNQQIVYKDRPVWKDKIIYKDRDVVKDKIVYKAPDEWVAAQDSKAICNGSKPVEIVQLDVSQNKDDNGKVTGSTSWLLAKPVGSNVLITCSVSGDMNGFWKVGQIIMVKIASPHD